MSKRVPQTSPPKHGPSWPSYRAMLDARAEARRAEGVNLPWLLWLMLVQPRLALRWLRESGTAPLVGSAILVLLATLVQAATLYSRNANGVSVISLIAAQPSVSLPTAVRAVAGLSPSLLLVIVSGLGLLLWLLLSALSYGYLRLVGVSARFGFRDVAVGLAFAAMPLLAEAMLLPFLLLLEGDALYTIDTIFKLLLVPWTLWLVYLALRSLGAARGQVVVVMLLIFLTLQFVVTVVVSNIIIQAITNLLAPLQLKH